VHDQLLEERRVRDEPGPTVHPQGVAAARDEEVEADVGLARTLRQPPARRLPGRSAGAAVAGSLGRRDGAVVEDVHEPARR
jgi:hypothetical protein